MSQACVVAPREAGGLPRGARLRARALMYLALLAGSALAAARVLPSPMYLASALADPSLPQVPPCTRVHVSRVCLAAARVLPWPLYLASALEDPALPQLRPLASCTRLHVSRVCLAAAPALPSPTCLASALADPLLPQALLGS